MRKFILCLSLILFSNITYAYDWEKVSLSGGVDVVTDYNWRGQHLGGLSLQPYVDFGFYGFNLGAWASVGSGSYDDFNQLVPELDLSLTYTTPDEHFTLGLTHYYYFDGPFFGGSYELDNLGSSQSEISVSVFGHEEYPLEFGFAMMFGEGDYWSANGCLVMENETKAKKLFSTYIYLKYTFEVDDVEFIPEIGLSPAPSIYTYYNESTGKHVGFAMNNISFTCNYTFLETDYVTMYTSANIYFNLFDVGYEQFEYGKNCGVSLGLGIEL
jgi:hypothetical protein